MNSDFEVIVVGAGPAGCMAAWTLAREGMRVALVEKARPPRHKTCGGGLLARARANLPFEVAAVVERECFVAELHHHAPALCFSTQRARPIVSMVMRDRFDHCLSAAAENAGALLIPDTVVTGVKFGADHVALRTETGTELRASFVVAADGVNSAVARLSGLPALPDAVPALEAEIESDQFERFAGAARFDFGLAPYGYAWVFPKRKHLSVGVLTTRRGSCNLNDEYARYLAKLGLDQRRELARHGYMIPLRPRRGLFAHPRVLLTGDAAGLADPIMAEGISAALSSGRLAAQAIVTHGADARAVTRAYRAALERTWLADLRVARFLARVLYGCPRVRAMVLKHRGRVLAEFMTRVVFGESGYRRAVRRPWAGVSRLGGEVLAPRAQS